MKDWNGEDRLDRDAFERVTAALQAGIAVDAADLKRARSLARSLDRLAVAADTIFVSDADILAVALALRHQGHGTWRLRLPDGAVEVCVARLDFSDPDAGGQP